MYRFLLILHKLHINILFFWSLHHNLHSILPWKLIYLNFLYSSLILIHIFSWDTSSSCGYSFFLALLNHHFFCLPLEVWLFFLDFYLPYGSFVFGSSCPILPSVSGRVGSPWHLLLHCQRHRTHCHFNTYRNQPTSTF